MTGSGIVSMSIGVGALVLTLVEDSDLIFATAFTSMTGLGLLIAAVVLLRLSRKWGIFEEDSLQDQSGDVLPDTRDAVEKDS
jgi:hypothetical protein